MMPSEIYNESKDFLQIVLFDEFSDSSLNFHLLVWTIEFSDSPAQPKSCLYYAMFEKFK